MKVAMIGQKGIPASWGGVEQHVEKLAVELTTFGLQVFAYGRAYYADPVAAQAFAAHHPRLYPITLPTVRSKHFDTIVHTFLATVHAMLSGVDVFHYHGVGPSLLSWIPRVFQPQARVLVTFHSIDRLHQKWGWFARLMLTLSEWTATHFPHQTIVVSKDLQQYVKARYKCDATYIPNGVLPATILPADQITKQFGLTTGSYALFVSRLIPHKRAHDVIAAFKTIQTDKQLVIVGDASHTESYVAELKALAADDSRIIFTGFQTGSVLQELFSNAAVFVQPSESEGLSVAVLEAGSYGLGVIVSDIAANTEIVGESGVTFPVGDITALAQALQTALADQVAMTALGAELQQHVIEHYNWQTIATAVNVAYEDTCPTVVRLQHQAVRALVLRGQ